MERTRIKKVHPGTDLTLLNKMARRVGPELNIFTMAFCPADCANITVTVNEPGGCDLKVRKRNIDRIGFFPCSVDLPVPFTCVGLEGWQQLTRLPSAARWPT